MTETAQLALIAVLGTFLTGFLGVISLALRILLKRASVAARAAKVARKHAGETRKAINGRMDERILLERSAAYKDGFADGVASVTLPVK